VPEVKYNGEIQEIMVRLARIEQKLDDAPLHKIHDVPLVKEKMAGLSERVGKVETQVAGDRKITVGVSAVTAGILLALKWVFVK
jgi:hypothetical protein